MSDNDKDNVSDDVLLKRKRKEDENQNRTDKIKKRKPHRSGGRREWNETYIEIGNESDEKNDKAIQTPTIDTDDEQNGNVLVQTKYPQKIDNRRKSVRVQHLASNKKSSPKQQVNGSKKSTPKQGKPNETHDKSKSKSTEETEQTSDTTKSSSSSKSESTVDSAIQTKSELSALIFKQFSDIKKDPKFESRYSAKCNHCDQRKNFLKGINTNLKSHLERVIFVRLFHSFQLLPNLHCIESNFACSLFHVNL